MCQSNLSSLVSWPVQRGQEGSRRLVSRTEGTTVEPCHLSQRVLTRCCWCQKGRPGPTRPWSRVVSGDAVLQQHPEVGVGATECDWYSVLRLCLNSIP